ncbi:HAD family hydrolase [Sediminicola luteus]|uniref:HAD family hydrolase n=1 Tax=Sediminicola luteus TaxID=319238 RepID=A0A2A4GFN0_9FLAO|nr:HAD family hydrolase [Sediminicola luteus]
MKTIKLVVFDMAGTTVNEDNVVYKTVTQALEKHGCTVTLDYVLEHGAGKEKLTAITDILNLQQRNDIDPQAVFTDFKSLLEAAYHALEVTTYTGMETLLETLRQKDIKIALNTGYDNKTATLLLDKMEWQAGSTYDVLVTADDVERGRPQPDMILKAMELCGISDPSQVLKAGDSAIDIEEGKNVNCGITIGVTTGAQTREQLELAQPTAVLDSLVELKKYL